MIIDKIIKDGYAIDNLSFQSHLEWIRFCENFMTIRKFPNFWSMLPGSNDQIMLLSTKKINNRDCHVSRPTLLDWHYDGIGIINREDLIALYCKIPNSVTRLLDLKKMYSLAPLNIKRIIHKSVIELDFNEKIYESSNREKMLVRKVIEEFEKEFYKPMIQIHPITLNKSILYHPNLVKKIHAISIYEKSLFVEFYNSYFDQCIITHKWKKNDILIMDQNSIIHSREPFEGERELWRISGWFKDELL